MVILVRSVLDLLYKLVSGHVLAGVIVMKSDVSACCRLTRDGNAFSCDMFHLLSVMMDETYYTRSA